MIPDVPSHLNAQNMQEPGIVSNRIADRSLSPYIICQNIITLSDQPNYTGSLMRPRRSAAPLHSRSHPLFRCNFVCRRIVVDSSWDVALASGCRLGIQKDDRSEKNQISRNGRTIDARMVKAGGNDDKKKKKGESNGVSQF